MRSQGRSRRSGGNNEHEDESYTNTARGDEPQDTYSRPLQSSHRTGTYRTSSTTGRVPYDSERDGPSSRGRRDDDWDLADVNQDRYVYPEPYHREKREVYDVSVPSNSSGWRSSGDSQRKQSRGEWSRHYEHSSLPTSYSAPASSWNSAATDSYNNSRGYYYDQWPQRDVRESSNDNRQQESSNEKPTDRGTHNWRREHRREKGDGKKFQSDSGWDTRRREKAWVHEVSSKWDEPSLNKGSRSVEERSWEPAATWKSSNRVDQPRGQNGHRYTYSKSLKGGKRGQNATKQRRDWRSDDGNLNKCVLLPMSKLSLLILICIVVGQKETQRIARGGSILKAHRGENTHGLPLVLVLDPDLLLSRIDHSAPHEASLVHGRYLQV